MVGEIYPHSVMHVTTAGKVETIQGPETPLTLIECDMA